MRIALRTGGGRGVYELAGSQGSYKASDLFGKELYYELTPDLVVAGRARADVRQGKPRIKLDDQKITTHFYRLLASLLLLPKPKREFKVTSGEVLIAYEAYSCLAIRIDLCSVQSHKVIVRPTDLLLANHSGLEQRIRFVDRLSRILALWTIADNTDSELAELLRKHRDSFYVADVDYKATEKAAMAVMKYLDTIYDPLERIERLMGIISDIASDDEDLQPLDLMGGVFGLDDVTTPQLARIQNIKRWRKVAVRGSAASKFRLDVRESYNDTCLFSGQRLPKMVITPSAGVDAAHILPWSSHNINTVENGICINKQCHWAFDSGVLRLSYQPKIQRYVIDIPHAIASEASICGFDIASYSPLTGPIPECRLPKDKHLWPNPGYLDEYNRFMFETI